MYDTKEENKEKLKEIFEYCNIFQQYELKVEKINKICASNTIYTGIGYLIDNDLLRIWKNNIFYNNLKNCLDYGFNICKKIIENKYKIYGYKRKYISQTNFDFAEDFIEQIKNNPNENEPDYLNNKQYILISPELWNQISHIKKRNDKGIKYEISNQIITLILNENNVLKFEFNNFLFDKDTLIEEIDENKKVDVIILIKLYFMEKNFKEKINDFSNSKEKFYLIPKLWSGTYKNQFFYNDLKTFLYKNRNEININTPCETILGNLPPNYRRNINRIKDKYSIKDIKFEYDIASKKITEDRQLKYLRNFVIINEEIFELLTSENYFENVGINHIKKCEIIKVKFNYLLTLKNQNDDINDTDIIGSLDKNFNFIEEYLLDFNDEHQ